jgi:hypothetical protein
MCEFLCELRGDCGVLDTVSVADILLVEAENPDASISLSQLVVSAKATPLCMGLKFSNFISSLWGTGARYKKHAVRERPASIQASVVDGILLGRPVCYRVLFSSPSGPALRLAVARLRTAAIYRLD